MTAGEGMATCSSGRIKTHTQNARSVKEMIQYPFYQEHPAKGVENIRGNMGKHWDDLSLTNMGTMGRSSTACTSGANKPLTIWRGWMGASRTINNKLRAVAYLWEICDDLLLAKANNVSRSPRFEGLGLSIYK